MTNGSGEFSPFEQSVNGNTTTIKVIAKYEWCTYTQDAPLRKTIYNFNQTVPETYILKLKMGDDTFKTETVLIP